jgi:hypothetical protein
MTTKLKSMEPPTKLTASSVAKLAAQSERFGRCSVVFFPPQFVWTRLQELHRASLRKPDAKHLAPKQARSYYDAVRTASLSQLWVGADSTRQAWFNHLLDAIEQLRSFDGLETPFLSGLNTAQVAGQHGSVERGVRLWRRYGVPAHLGGGHSRSPVLDTTRNAIVFVDHKGLSSLGPKGAHSALLDPKTGGVLAAGSKASGIFDAGVAQDGDPCENFFKAGGALAGTSLGALGGALVTAPGGPAAVGGFIGGAIAGGAGGATIGGALGGALCPGLMQDDSEEEDDTEEETDTETETQNQGTTGGEIGGYGGAGGAGSSPGESIMFGDDNSSGSGQNQSGGESQNQSSSDQNQSSSDQNQSSSDQNQSSSSSDQNQSSSDGSNQSGGDGSSSGSGSGDGNKSGGMPDPDDPHGVPNPDDPHGRSWISDTCAFGSVASHAAYANGAWTFGSVPRLAADGSLASAGFLSAIPAVAETMSQQQSQADQSQSVVDQGLAGDAGRQVETP